jgi:hypothetical protein
MRASLSHAGFAGSFAYCDGVRPVRQVAAAELLASVRNVSVAETESCR